MFGIAELSDDGKNVKVFIEGGGEVRLQTYTATVPFTVVVESKGEPKKHVTRYKSLPDQKRLVYHGIKMTGPGDLKNAPSFQYPRPRHSSYVLKDCEFLDLKGKKVSANEVSKRLAMSRQPIFIVRGDERIDPFFRRALNPDMLMFVPPDAEKDQTRKGPLPPQLKPIW